MAADTPSTRVSAPDVPGALHGYSVQALKHALEQPKDMHPVSYTHLTLPTNREV